MKKILFTACILVFAAGHAKANELFTLAQNASVPQLQAHISQNKYAKPELTRALHMAVDKNPSVDVITVLVQAGADVNSSLTDAEVYTGEPGEYVSDSNAQGDSPLARAWENIPKMAALLQAGANPNESAFEGGTLFTQEASHARKPSERMVLLLKYKADPNYLITGPNCTRDNVEKDIEGAPCTALEFAINYPETVRLLLDAGAQTNWHIYNLALKTTLPQDLKQRLDPTRLPNGSQKTIKQLFSSVLGYVKNNNFNDCKNTLDDLHRSFELPPVLISSLYYLKSICRDHDVEAAANAVRFDPKQPRNHLQYVTSLLHADKYKEALSAIAKAMKILSNDARIYLYRGIAHMRLGNARQASMDIERSLSLKEMSQAYFARGELHILTGDEKKAQSDLIKALNMGQKTNADMNLLYQASIKERNGDISEAVILTQKAQATSGGSGRYAYVEPIGNIILIPANLIDPIRRKYLYERHYILKNIKQEWKDENNDISNKKMCVDSLMSYIKQFGSRDSAPFYYLLTFCTEDTEKQIQHINKSIQAAQKECIYHYRRGEIYFRSGRYALAQKDFARAMEYGQQNKAHQNLLYQAYITAHDSSTQNALPLVEKARAFAKTAPDREAVDTAFAALAAGELPSIVATDALILSTTEARQAKHAEESSKQAEQPDSAQQPPLQHNASEQNRKQIPAPTESTPRMPVIPPAMDGEALDTFL